MAPLFRWHPSVDTAAAIAAQAAADDADAAMDRFIIGFGRAGADGAPLRDPGDPHWFGEGKGRGKDDDALAAWRQDTISVECADRMRALSVRVGCEREYNAAMAGLIAERRRRSLVALGATPKARPRRPHFESTDLDLIIDGSL